MFLIFPFLSSPQAPVSLPAVPRPESCPCSSLGPSPSGAHRAEGQVSEATVSRGLCPNPTSCISWVSSRARPGLAVAAAGPQRGSAASTGGGASPGHTCRAGRPLHAIPARIRFRKNTVLVLGEGRHSCDLTGSRGSEGRGLCGAPCRHLPASWVLLSGLGPGLAVSPLPGQEPTCKFSFGPSRHRRDPSEGLGRPGGSGLHGSGIGQAVDVRLWERL